MEIKNFFEKIISDASCEELLILKKSLEVYDNKFILSVIHLIDEELNKRVLLSMYGETKCYMEKI